MERGTVWWAELSQPVASEPGYRRPVIIIQANSFNRSRIKTIMVLVVTANLRLADGPGNVSLPAASTGLPKDSVANVSQVITVDKSILVEECGRIPSVLMKAIDEGLRLSLSP
ncbi:MAG TPA: type II toxin-antitoxin system PemK/MazF family toxin [Candidatus Methanoperedens sp.]|nr:type II toxin-antitoxin system PemK/MazF family toxin [Candidatus Methanoperedens sp.]